MSPVEMLEELSNMYRMITNELFGGKRLSTEEYMDMAETNIKNVEMLVWLALFIALKLQDVDVYLVGMVAGVIIVLHYAVLNNRMMVYVGI